MRSIHSQWPPSPTVTERVETFYQGLSSHFPFKTSTQLSQIPKPWIMAAVGLLFLTVMGWALWIRKKPSSLSKSSQSTEQSPKPSSNVNDADRNGQPSTSDSTSPSNQISEANLNSKSPPTTPSSEPSLPSRPTLNVSNGDQNKPSSANNRSQENVEAVDPNSPITEESDEQFEDAETSFDEQNVLPEELEAIKKAPIFYTPQKKVVSRKTSPRENLIELFQKFFAGSNVLQEGDFIKDLSTLFAPDRIQQITTEALKTTLTYEKQVVILTQNITISMFNDLPIRLGQRIEVEIDNTSPVRTLTFLQGAPCAEITTARGWIKTTVSVKTLKYDSQEQALGVDTNSTIVNTALSPFLPAPLEKIQISLGKGHLVVQ